MKYVYHAYFTANNGATYHNKPFSYTNKKTAIKSIKEICRGNLDNGKTGVVRVYMVPQERADELTYYFGDLVFEKTVR